MYHDRTNISWSTTSFFNEIMEQQTEQQSQNQPQGSNNAKTSGIAIAVLLVLIAAYAFTQKKEPEPTVEPVTDDGVEEIENDDEDVTGQEPVEDMMNVNAGEDMGITNTNTSATENDSNSPVRLSAYKDGTYSAVGDYVSPGGAEQVGVTVTLKDGVIVDSSLRVLAERPISVKMQEQVRDGHKTLVIGKPLDEVKLDKVSSSSLTPIGFNDAIEKIKRQATS